MANKHPLISPEIHARVDAARVARLATLEADKTPHVIPICFVWGGGGLLFGNSTSASPRTSTYNKRVHTSSYSSTNKATCGDSLMFFRRVNSVGATRFGLRSRH